MSICRSSLTRLLIGIWLAACLQDPALGDDSTFESDPVFVVGGLLDDTGAWDLQAGVDWKTSEKTSLFAGAGVTETDSSQGDLSTKWLTFGIDHRFSGFGITGDIEYWGEEDRVTTLDFKGSLYFETDKARVAVLGEARDIEITFQSLTGEQREITTDSTAIGGSLRVEPTENLLLYVSGKDYEYHDVDRTNLILLCLLRPDICVANSSPLILARSFLKFAVSAGFDYQFSSVAFNLDFSNAESFLDEREFDVLSGGLVFAAGRRTDIELIAGVSSSENSSDIWFGGINLYFYR